MPRRNSFHSSRLFDINLEQWSWNTCMSITIVHPKWHHCCTRLSRCKTYSLILFHFDLFRIIQTSDGRYLIKFAFRDKDLLSAIIINGNIRTFTRERYVPLRYVFISILSCDPITWSSAQLSCVNNKLGRLAWVVLKRSVCVLKWV